MLRMDLEEFDGVSRPRGKEVHCRVASVFPHGADVIFHRLLRSGRRPAGRGEENHDEEIPQRLWRHRKNHALQCFMVRRPGSRCQPACRSRLASRRRNVAWVTTRISECWTASSSSQAAALLMRSVSAADGYCPRIVSSRVRPPTASAHAGSGRRSAPRWRGRRSSSRSRGDTIISWPGASSRAEATARGASLESTTSALSASRSKWSGTRSLSWMPAASYASRHARKPFASIQPAWTWEERA